VKPFTVGVGCRCMLEDPWCSSCDCHDHERVTMDAALLELGSRARCNALIPTLRTFRQLYQQSTNMGGGGKAFRRRQKNAEKANVSLHKAAVSVIVYCYMCPSHSGTPQARL
jgi:hypothetical protein